MNAIAEIARFTRSPHVQLVAVIEAAEERLIRMTAAGEWPITIAGAAMEEVGKIILAKRAYLESVGQ